MASALARGWGDPVLVADALPERARALAAAVGGEAPAGNAELFARADLVVLCHKPGQLAEVAADAEAGEARPAIVSVLGSTPRERVAAAYPGSAVFRVLPNLPVEVRRGVLCWVPDPDADPGLAAEVEALFARLGRVVPLQEGLLETAMALTSNAPAFVALVVEAMVDAAVRHGLPAEVASEMALETLAGTSDLLRERGGDTLAVRRAVTSPGGSTARGLAALEAGGLREAFAAAFEAIVRESPS